MEVRIERRREMKAGDLIIDTDVFGDEISDIALVLEEPSQSTGHLYLVYYCTGPVAGDIVYETVHALSSFKVISKSNNKGEL